MDILIDNRSGEELPLERIEELATFVLVREGLATRAPELSISFVNRDEITALNARYRDRPEPTDVLSFALDDPWDEQDVREGQDAFAGSDEGSEGYDGGENGLPCEQGAPGILLGDIVINPDVAREHAERDGLGFEEELWVLVIHGILHLLGHDHEQADEMRRMEQREDEHLCQWELRLRER
jgi:probable rRNA maturation factor